MIIHTLPIEFEGKIIVPSKPITVMTGALSTIDLGEAVRIEEAEIKTPPNVMNLRTMDGREFIRVRGTVEENPRGKLNKGTLVEVWQRRT